MEKTFIIIKPEAIQHKEEIFEELDKHAERIKTSHIDSIPSQVIETHYANCKGKVFYPSLLNHFVGKSASIAIYQGKDVVNKFLTLLGPTEPKQGTLRHKYSQDTEQQARKENRPIINAIHRSGNIQEAEEEIKIWQSFFQN